MENGEEMTTTSQPVTSRQMSSALRHFERHPSHPGALIKPNYTRHTLYATLGSLVVVLGAVAAFFLAPQRLIEEWFFVAVLTLLPWWILTLNRLSERKKKRSCELVWTHHPDYAMARLKAYHMEGRGNSNELLRKQKLGRAVAIVSLSGASALMLCCAVVWNSSFSMANLSSGAIILTTIIVSTLLITLVGMSLLSTMTSASAKMKYRELKAERAHLKSIAPELFTKDQLEGAISLPGDNSDLKGALSQS